MKNVRPRADTLFRAARVNATRMLLYGFRAPVLRRAIAIFSRMLSAFWRNAGDARVRARARFPV